MNALLASDCENRERSLHASYACTLSWCYRPEDFRGAILSEGARRSHSIGVHVFEIGFLAVRAPHKTLT
jgi:hypothetical protein